MTEQLALTLAAASTGFVAAVFFAFGAAFTRHKTMVLLASTYWDYNEEKAIAAVSQSAQYFTGGVLLVLSFALQIRSALASPSVELVLHPLLSNPHLFVLAAVIATALVGWALYRVLLRWRLPPVLAELEAKAKR